MQRGQKKTGLVAQRQISLFLFSSRTFFFVCVCFRETRVVSLKYSKCKQEAAWWKKTDLKQDTDKSILGE